VSTIQAGDLALLLGSDRKHLILRLEPGMQMQTHQGVLEHDDMIGRAWGCQVQSHLGARFHVLRPTLRSLLLNIRRRSQIIFPKEIGYILLRLGVLPDMKIIEVGTGSGALTTALAWLVGPQGRVISYDRRADMHALALQNLRYLGLEERVRLCQRDIVEGLDEGDAHAIFLDIPDPHLYLPQVRAALQPGGVFGAILPTTNQVSDLLAALLQHDFVAIDVCEIMLRFFKPVPQRLRPTDRMVAHTGYLVFARSVLPSLGQQPGETTADAEQALSTRHRQSDTAAKE
jgi:tRNA (adenine57-N1/adenine58-N1)-methyltransferase